MKTATITITGLRLKAHHGVYEEERTNGQEFVIDMTIEADLGLAIQHDDVKETIDYSKLTEQVAELVRGAPVNLIETLADQIAALILEHPQAQTATVTVHKPNAPLSNQVDDVSVSVSQSKHN